MRTSNFLLATLKEVPSDAPLMSHQLMIRAGMIRKLASGLYTWLPMGLRVLQKITLIIREEMNSIGAQEILMPAIQPAELWQETGRWELFGPQLLRMKDRHDRDFCFGPTHEEVITDLIRQELRSYKQLPCTLYQIQMKFRDEIRPRFGVMRAREFLMKDAYSFHLDQSSLQATYTDMYNAYTKILKRLGLTFRAVLADSGAIGGSKSQEFHVLADSGEDAIAFCANPNSEYAANVETATSLEPIENRAPATQTCQLKHLPHLISVVEQACYLNIEPKQMLKTLLVKGRDAQHPIVALLLRGDHELNEIKAAKIPEVYAPLTMASLEDIKKTVSCDPGFIGPKDIKIPIIADREVMNLSDFAAGANQTDYHYIGLNWERDLPLPSRVEDLRMIQAGDLSPDGQGELAICRGIEVGHIFQLGNKYSKIMHAQVLDSHGKAVELEMGCYGFGVSRIIAATIEQSHDEKGIIWPDLMAPFLIALVPMNYHHSPSVKEATDALYKECLDLGIEVLLDDRMERPGVMFTDMELIGIPHRLVVGERGLKNNIVEYTNRKTFERSDILLGEPLSEFLHALQKAFLKL